MCRDDSVWSWPDLLLALLGVYSTAVCMAFLYFFSSKLASSNQKKRKKIKEDHALFLSMK
jgi:hypothetical protein